MYSQRGEESSATRWWLLLSFARSSQLCSPVGEGNRAAVSYCRLSVFPENLHQTAKSGVRAASTLRQSSWKTVGSEAGERRIPLQTSKPRQKRKEGFSLVYFHALTVVFLDDAAAVSEIKM